MHAHPCARTYRMCESVRVMNGEGEGEGEGGSKNGESE